MPGPGKGGRYHHGDLRAALVDTAIEIIGERGVRGFSLAARGHVMLLLDEGPGQGAEAIELAAERAARATLALIQGRHLLTRPSGPAAPGGSSAQGGH